MLARLIFLAIAAFWLTMNVMLWHLEYGVRGGDTVVPPQLVWHKILTAPDASSLSVYQKGERMGYCEISTGVGQQMASFDEGTPPSDEFANRNEYQLHLSGNVSLGDFTNRLKFDVKARFDDSWQWNEITAKGSAHGVVVEIHSLATNGTAHLKFSADGSPLLERDLTFAELRNPTTVIQAIAGNSVSDLLGPLEMAEAWPVAGSQSIGWNARRTRVKIGSEAIPIYRLETSFLGRDLSLDISTLGEILSVDLPDNVTAHIDEWNKKP